MRGMPNYRSGNERPFPIELQLFSLCTSHDPEASRRCVILIGDSDDWACNVPVVRSSRAREAADFYAATWSWCREACDGRDDENDEDRDRARRRVVRPSICRRAQGIDDADHCVSGACKRDTAGHALSRRYRCVALRCVAIDSIGADSNATI